MTEALAEPFVAPALAPEPLHDGGDTAWRYFAKLLAKPVPRYTSYPTAAEFHGGVGQAEQRRGLATIGADEPVSLYVHIPFCREICWYCACNTGRANRRDRLARYLAHLEQEIDQVSEAMEARGRIDRVAFGGGSPNAISAEQFAGLAQTLRSRFDFSDAAIWSVEVDPGILDEDFATALGQVGVARASLGVQTFNPDLQRAIGRIQPHEVIERCVTLLREAGITSLNFDLMYGLPGQDDAALIESIQRSETLGADRLAVFGYAHVPHLIARQRRIDAHHLPNANERFRAAHVAFQDLVGNGWQSIGFDHFARPHDPLAAAAREGRIRRNFQGFTDDGCNTLIGLGASGISRLPGALIQNEKNNAGYAERLGLGRFAGSRGVRLSEKDQRRAFIVERLLCAGAADLTEEEMSAARTALAPFSERGLIRLEGSACSLSPEARPYARAIAATFDEYRAASPVTLSSAV